MSNVHLPAVSPAMPGGGHGGHGAQPAYYMGGSPSPTAAEPCNRRSIPSPEAEAGLRPSPATQVIMAPSPWTAVAAAAAAVTGQQAPLQSNSERRLSLYRHDVEGSNGKKLTGVEKPLQLRERDKARNKAGRGVAAAAKTATRIPVNPHLQANTLQDDISSSDEASRHHYWSSWQLIKWHIDRNTNEADDPHPHNLHT